MDTDTHLLLVDGHVHLYGRFDLERLLDAASANFAKAAARHGRAQDFSGVLLLTETARDDAFGELSRSAAPEDEVEPAGPGWRFFQTAERISLLARKADLRLLLVAGRQIATLERLEVLALGTDRRFADGRPLAETLREVRACHAIPVLPWGVGKWFGRRGRLVEETLAASDGTEIFLGDNSGRPAFWPQPRAFRLAARRGIRILPGTDPLPIASEAARVGSFGFAIPGGLSGRPAEDLKRMLLRPDRPAWPYGRLERPARFLRNQIRIRLP